MALQKFVGRCEIIIRQEHPRCGSCDYDFTPFGVWFGDVFTVPRVGRIRLLHRREPQINPILYVALHQSTSERLTYLAMF